jgi:hypothetical protein
VVARTGDEWRPVKKFTRSDIDHSMIRGLGSLQLPHLDLAQVQDDWRPSRKNTADYFQGQMGLNAARKLVGLFVQQAGARLGGFSISQSNATITLSGGVPSRLVLESGFSGSGVLLSAGQGVQVVVITQFSNVGSTTVAMPAEAEAAIVNAQIR